MITALSAAGRKYRVTFESGSLTALQSAVRAGLGVTTMLPMAMAPGLSSLPVAPFLPELPDIDIGLARQPLSEGNVLTNAVEEMLKQLV
jgi:DNA-binding transcriptional LysR family regulator